MKISFLGNHSVDYSSETHHAKTLESMGHEVIRLQEGKATALEVWEAASTSNLFVWVHTHGWNTPEVSTFNMLWVLETLKRLEIPSLTYHLDLWLGLDRQKDLDNDPFYKHIQYFFCTDKLMAEWFNNHTTVKGHYLPAGVFDEECLMLEPDSRIVHHNNDVIFVGSRGYHKEWPYRPQLIDWLKQNYGSRFTHVGGDGSGTVRGLALNLVYANSKISIGDTLCIGFNYPYYYSDRLFESSGRGSFTIFPYIKGIEDCFEIGKEIVTYTYGDFTELKNKIDYYLENDEEREAIRQAGHDRAKRDHTYRKRWETILETVGLA